MNFNRLAQPYAWLTDHHLWRAAMREVAKQLPPSRARLRLLDVSCGAGTALRDLLALRPDVLPLGVDSAWGMVALGQRRNPQPHYLHGDAYRLPFATDSIDAVLIQRTYYFLPNQEGLLGEAMRVLRPGGRLVMLDPTAGRSPWSAWRTERGRAALDMFALHLAAQRVGGFTPTTIAERLQAAGFARILAEPLLNGWAVMSRGEKPYAGGASTLERVRLGAAGGGGGRYVHVLVLQSPDKPAWKLQPDEIISWGAVALAGQPPQVLGFSSLPKAVAFMQAAVLAGVLTGVNKVGKFSQQTAASWDFPLVLDPELDAVRDALPGVLVALDPAHAEAADE